MFDGYPAVIAWEVTRRCAMSCRHCRGAARDRTYEGELSTKECLRVIDGIAASRGDAIDRPTPILIFTGGEPMMRPDLVELVAHATTRGIRAVMAPCGHLLTRESAAALKEAGIRCMSISFDGATAATHDAFRGVPDAFDRSIRGFECAREAGVALQINTTVSRVNLLELPAILEFAVSMGASALDLFFLVPTGRGKALRHMELSPLETERILAWVQEADESAPIRVKTTCAPQSVRIAATRPVNEGSHRTGRPGSALRPGHGGSGGCMAGRGFVFISHRGILQPCGFLDIPSGDLRRFDFDFDRAYRESPVFQSLCDFSLYKGKCGACEFVASCGGCRARAYAATCDYLEAEPTCSYTPKRRQEAAEEG